MDPALAELIADGNPEEEVPVIVRVANARELPPNLRVVADFGEVKTARVRRADIVAIRAHPTVVSVKASEDFIADIEEGSVSAETAVRQGDERRPKGLRETGRGTVVAVLDWGCDFAHADFRDEAGQTRLLALWDQRGGYLPKSPQPYGYGVAHRREGINQSLASGDPFAHLGYHPADADPRGTGAHGTHCLGIAAGNGRSGGPSGVAPEAELIFVHLTDTRSTGLANLGDSITILEAIDFVARTAADRPWVISLSVGNHGGPHDGLSLVERALDSVIGRPGRAVCQSVGNYFDKQIAATGQLRPGGQRTLAWQVSGASRRANELEVWYPGADVFDLEVLAPDGSSSGPVGLGRRKSMKRNGQTICSIHHRSVEPNNGKHHINIFVQPGAPAGAWRVRITGVDVADGRYHAWVERDGTCPRCQSRFSRNDAVSTTTLGAIANGYRPLAVGAYERDGGRLRVASFSSSGPTADGRQKPDLVAPGVKVLSARSCPRNKPAGTSLLVRMSGTSMAAPHVAGTVALMFEAARRPLAVHETRALLLRSARTISSVHADPLRTGDGILDIAAAVRAARHVGSAATGRADTGAALPALGSALGEGPDSADAPPGASAGQLSAEALGSLSSHELVDSTDFTHPTPRRRLNAVPGSSETSRYPATVDVVPARGSCTCC
jgi:subtilisin family serine protease